MYLNFRTSKQQSRHIYCSHCINCDTAYYNLDRQQLQPFKCNTWISESSTICARMNSNQGRSTRFCRRKSETSTASTTFQLANVGPSLPSIHIPLYTYGWHSHSTGIWAFSINYRNSTWWNDCTRRISIIYAYLTEAQQILLSIIGMNYRSVS